MRTTFLQPRCTLSNSEESVGAMDKENKQPNKKQRLSLSLKKDRFKPVSQDKLDEMAKPFVAKNTELSGPWLIYKNGFTVTTPDTKWIPALKNFCHRSARPISVNFCTFMLQKLEARAAKSTLLRLL